MHTLRVMLGGFLLLGLCLILGRWSGGTGAVRLASHVFIVLWFIATLLNLWMGVSKAGYTVIQELPIALVVFIVPALSALFLSQLLR